MSATSLITELVLHSGIDVGYVPPTPLPNQVPPVMAASERLLEYANFYGYPVGYQQEQHGKIVQNIIPIKTFESAQISGSSAASLSLHTEAAFHPYRPDFVLLLCLRGDYAAKTTYAKLTDILQELPKKYVRILEQEQFTTSIDMSYRLDGQADTKVPIAILNKKDNTYQLRYDEELIRATNSKAAEALSALKVAITNTTQDIVLNTGDMLVLNNHRVLHGRSTFKARYDGTDRWLQRCLVLSALPQQSQYKTTYTITTSF